MKVITNKLIIVLAFVLSSIINVCSAAPNLWKDSFIQGFMEYSIVNEQGDSVIITCNIGAGYDYDNSLAVSLADNKEYSNDKSSIEFVIEDESYPVPSMSIGIQGSGMWDRFIEAISKATVFDVYVDNKKVSHFNPKPNNVKKVLKNMDCDSLAGKKW